MVNSGKRSFGQELNTWVQTIGIIIAALWGGYTFFYKEIRAPKSAPTNITLNLELKKIRKADLENKDRNKGPVPVEIKVSAKNLSSRQVYLLACPWLAYGEKVRPLPKAELFSGEGVISEQNKNFYKQRHCEFLSATVIAFGGLFSDIALRPNEVATRTLLVYFPLDEYDVLEVVMAVPTVGKRGAIEAEWKLNEKEKKFDLTMYRLSATGERKIMEKNKDGSYPDEEKFELQMFYTTSMFPVL